MTDTTAEVSMERRGSGDPIVLLHGIGSRWQCFEPVLDRLAESHEVVAIDLPGFGASPLLDGVRPGPRGYADWLAGWLGDQGIERPHVVGSSMGGGIALELGRRGVASAVTAFSPVGFWGTPGLRWTQAMLTVLRVGTRHAEPLFGRMVDHPVGRAVALASMFGHPTRVPADTARADIGALAAATGFERARADFARYRLAAGDDLGSLPDIPVTIAWGTRDVVLIHRTQSAQARALLPNACHVDLPGCGHLPFFDDPVTCARLVLEAATQKENR